MSNSDEERAQKAMESQILQAQISELEKQLDEISSKKAELLFIKESLNQIKNQSNKDILLPLGSGILIRGKLTDDKKVLVNIGGNTIVEKSVDEAKQIIDKQIEEISSVSKLIDNEIKKYSSIYNQNP